MEHSSEHPIAKMVIQEVERQNIQFLPIKDFDSITGQGIEDMVSGHHIIVGNIHLLESLHIETKTLKERAEILRKHGATVVLIAILPHQLNTQTFEETFIH